MIAAALSRADVGRLELVKWLAFGAMVVDHIDLAVFGRSVPWMHLVGGFAFPAFALCLGFGLACTRDPLAVGSRLVLPAVLAQVAWFFVEPDHPPNVLAMFALCAFGLASPLAATAVVPVAWWLGEGGIFLPLLVAGGYLSAREGWAVPAVVSCALWAVLAGSPGALVALVVFLFAPSVRLPRVRGLLAWGYAGHLALLAALKAALSLAG